MLPEDGAAKNKDLKDLLMSGSVFLQQLEDNEVNFALVTNPKVVFTDTKILDFLIEIQGILNKYHDIVLDDLPSDFHRREVSVIILT